jgi:hypothetical protein
MQPPTYLASDRCPPSGVASTSTWLMHVMVELCASKVEPLVTLASVPKVLQMLLAAWVPSQFPANWSFHMPALPDTIFWSSWQRPSSGDWLDCTRPRHDVVSFCCVKLTEITLEIDLQELTVPFECCILETEQMETGGRFWYRKCIKWVQKLFCQQLLLLLRWDIFLFGPY